MSNWCYLLNRSVLKPRRFNIESSIKPNVEIRGISCIANDANERRNNAINSKPLIKVRSASYATKNNLRLSQDNIVSSALKDIKIPQELIHEYVWKNLERWPDKIATVGFSCVTLLIQCINCYLYGESTS